MARYRKKPVEVQAFQLVGDAGETMKAINLAMAASGCGWLQGDWTKPDELEGDKGIYIDPDDGALVIRTLEGDMKALMSDWLIVGVEGELYPCKDSIFQATYKKVE